MLREALNIKKVMSASHGLLNWIPAFAGMTTCDISLFI
jgi:hypothetical protein